MIVIQRESRVNQRINTKEVRLIGPDGEQMGVVPTQEALQKAQEFELDLVEVASQTSPPVCRIMNYSKYKYEQKKKTKEARKHQSIIHLKEIKIKPNIEEHDYQVKLYHLKRFLGRGDKAKVTMIFRGRERSHMDIGKKIIDRIVSDLVGIGDVELGPIYEGRSIIINFIPCPTVKTKKTVTTDARSPRCEAGKDEDGEKVKGDSSSLKKAVIPAKAGI